MKAIFFTILVFAISCTKQPKATNTNIGINFLESNKIEIENTGIINPKYIENIKDEFFVIIDNKNENIFNVFSLPEKAYQYSWGMKGMGPGELSEIFTLANSRIVEDDIILHEPSQFRIQHYALSNISLKEINNQTIRYSGQLMPINGLRQISDSLFFAIYDVNSNTDYEFISLAPDNFEPVYKFGDYPDSELSGPMRAQNFHKATAVKPDGKKIVAFYMYHPKMKIYDQNGTLLLELEISDSLHLTEIKGRVTLRNLVKVSDNFIYVLSPYSTHDEQFLEGYKPYFEVWNWEGKLIKKIKVNDPIHYFTVSEKYNTIYAISYQEANYLYSYDLSQIIDN